MTFILFQLAPILWQCRLGAASGTGGQACLLEPPEHVVHVYKVAAASHDAAHFPGVRRHIRTF